MHRQLYPTTSPLNKSSKTFCQAAGLHPVYTRLHLHTTTNVNMLLPAYATAAAASRSYASSRAAPLPTEQNHIWKIHTSAHAVSFTMNRSTPKHPATMTYLQSCQGFGGWPHRAQLATASGRCRRCCRLPSIHHWRCCQQESHAVLCRGVQGLTKAPTVLRAAARACSRGTKFMYCIHTFTICPLGPMPGPWASSGRKRHQHQHQ